MFLHHFIHIPWTQSDSWRVLPARIRSEIFTGLLANDIIGFHTRSYRRNFLQCCRDLMDLEVEFDRGVVHFGDREVWVRAYPLPIDHRATRMISRSARVNEFEKRAGYTTVLNYYAISNPPATPGSIIANNDRDVTSSRAKVRFR